MAALDIDASVPHRKTLLLVNNFVVHTTQFINRFAGVAEEKLNAVSRNIERLEVTMSILEAKLNSIPGLAAGGNAQPAQQSGSAPPPAEGAPAAPPPPAEGGAPPPPPSAGGDAAAEAPPAPAPDAPPAQTITSHPEYAKYFKMVNFGVPLMSVKQKMAIEGLNPDLLDNPDAPWPDGDGGGAAAAPPPPSDPGAGGAPPPPPPPAGGGGPPPPPPPPPPM